MAPSPKKKSARVVESKWVRHTEKQCTGKSRSETISMYREMVESSFRKYKLPSCMLAPSLGCFLLLMSSKPLKNARNFSLRSGQPHNLQLQSTLSATWSLTCFNWRKSSQDTFDIPLSQDRRL